MKNVIVAVAVLGAALPAFAQEVIPRNGRRLMQQDEEPQERVPLEPLDKKPDAEKSAASSLPFNVERPTFTYSPSLLDAGSLCVEAGGYFVGESYKNIDTDTMIGIGVARYGVSGSIEGFLEAELFKQVRGTDAERNEDIGGTGIGDARLGLKWAMLGEGSILPALTTVAMWKIPTGSASKELGTGEGDMTLLTAVGQKVMGEVMLEANFGVSFTSIPQESGRFFMQYLGSVSAQYQLGNFILIGEYRWLSQLEDTRGVRSSVMAGAGFYLSKAIRIDVGVSLGLSDDAEDYQLTFGVSTVAGKLF